MLKKQLVLISCDECSVEQSIMQGDGYPYDKDWVYLYALNFQIKQPRSKSFRRLIFQDKHFCSPKCMLGFIAAQIVKEDDNEGVKGKAKRKTK